MKCILCISCCFSLTGKYAEEFVQKRRERLERWLNRLSRHPLVSKSEVFQHFLLCKDGEEKVRGKPFLYVNILLYISYATLVLV